MPRASTCVSANFLSPVSLKRRPSYVPQAGGGAISRRITHPMRQIGWSSVIPTIDRESIVPIYQQIYEGLREAILTGALPESARLPPERSLAEALGVNRSTVVH